MPASDSGVVMSATRYQDFAAGFSAAAIEAQLAGRLEGGVNACVECCDRHVQPGRVALVWENKDAQSARLTFARLKEQGVTIRQNVAQIDDVAVLRTYVEEDPALAWAR